MRRSTLIALAIAFGPLPVAAQTPPSAPAAAAAPTAASAKAAAPRQCMRLPLSDIAVGRPETIALAQLRLGEYADKEAKKRGWKGTLVKSDEKVACEDYLYLPLVGQEYKCLVTATFCAGPAAPAARKPVAVAAKAAPKAAVKPAVKPAN